MKLEYINITTPQEAVNQKGSRYWIQMNDNSRAKTARENFVNQYGGFFRLEKKIWIWVSPVQQQNGYWLKNIHTEEKVFFSNMAEFAKLQGMTSGKICELLNGRRKTYKGWTAVELRPVKDSVAQHVKAKEVKKKLIGVPKTVNLQNMDTNEVIFVTNIKQFAKENKLFPGSLYKLLNGKVKTVKNFKLHTPFS